MTDPSYLRRLEQRLTMVRWLGVIAVAAAVLAPTGIPTFPGQIRALAQIVVLPILVVGTIAIGISSRLIKRDSFRRALGFGAFGFDVFVVFACVWLFGLERPLDLAGFFDRSGDVAPLPTVALLLLLPIEGAARFRMKGALFAAAIVVAFFAALTWQASQFDQRPFDLGNWVFVTILTGAMAYLLGSAAEMWHRNNEAMRQQANRLVELDRLRDRYVAITSHEIRGPLTAIITGIDTVRTRGDRMDDETRSRLLDMVAQQGNQLARLVDDLMIGSEVEAGELAIRSELVDLESTVQRGVEGASPKRRAHQLELFIEPVRCEIDPYRISQMLRNLIENAYKYTPDRTRVVVSGKAVEDGIELEVADDGPGIPLEKRDKLFEAFSRMRETAAGKEGVGLGLYVVSQLAIAMEGRIDLASSSRGTSFTIRIPCRTEPIEHRRMGLISNEEV